jgi:hypothetical protein
MAQKQSTRTAYVGPITSRIRGFLFVTTFIILSGLLPALGEKLADGIDTIAASFTPQEQK